MSFAHTEARKRTKRISVASSRVSQVLAAILIRQVEQSQRHEQPTRSVLSLVSTHFSRARADGKQVRSSSARSMKQRAWRGSNFPGSKVTASRRAVDFSASKRFGPR